MMLPTRSPIRLGAACGALLLWATAALAQNPPLPPVRPGSAPSAGAPGAPTQTAKADSTLDQATIVERANAYLNSLSALSGDFSQVGADGRNYRGKLYVQKPGKLRFEYNPPAVIEVVSDGTSVVVRDRKLATQDIYPLSQTPLRFLLSDRIDLLKDTNVVNVTADDVFISVTIEEKQALIGTSRLMLMIGTKDGQLKQWTVTDPQGYDTTVAVYNLDSSRKVDPGLFKIDFTNYSTPPG